MRRLAAALLDLVACVALAVAALVIYASGRIENE
jgi:hypothetical protein